MIRGESCALQCASATCRPISSDSMSQIPATADPGPDDPDPGDPDPGGPGPGGPGPDSVCLLSSDLAQTEGLWVLDPD